MHGVRGDLKLTAKDQSDARRPGSGTGDAEKATETGNGSSAGQVSGKREREGKGKSEQAPGGVSRALKTVYDDTLREDVPKDFLDLLGKLN